MPWKAERSGNRCLISVAGDGFCITPVPEPTAAELTAVFAALYKGRPCRAMTSEDEARVQDEIRRYRNERRKR